MEFIVWDSAYATGIPKIDKQHQGLISFLNTTVHNATGIKADELAYFYDKIDEGIKLLKKHFSTETAILARSGYDKLKEHKKEHTRLLKELKGIKQKILNRTIEMDLFAVTAYLKELIIKHITLYDVTAKKYLKEGVTLPKKQKKKTEKENG